MINTHDHDYDATKERVATVVIKFVLMLCTDSQAMNLSNRLGMFRVSGGREVTIRLL